jgi:hypothetical protein
VSSTPSGCNRHHSYRTLKPLMSGFGRACPQPRTYIIQTWAAEIRWFAARAPCQRSIPFPSRSGELVRPCTAERNGSGLTDCRRARDATTSAPPGPPATVHPRAFGKRVDHAIGEHGDDGSPPRVRRACGNPVHHLPSIAVFRFISARAGRWPRRGALLESGRVQLRGDAVAVPARATRAPPAICLCPRRSKC